MIRFLLILVFISSAFADETLTFKATYQVPTDLGQNADFSTFELQEYTVLKRDVAKPSKARLSYFLPARMMGIKQKIEMELMIEELPKRVFMGDDSIALCEGAWKEMKCSVRFTNLQYNFRRLNTILRNENLGDSEISSRLEMMKKFAHDPLGVSKIIP